VANLIDQPDVINVYIYGCRVYPIRKEVLADKEKATVNGNAVFAYG
jgi:hypothetical protein